jgi:hypothetical protein
MPQRWLQDKGDLSAKKFHFHPIRKSSLFDEHFGQLHKIILTICTVESAFHLKAHYSSSQLTCLFYDDPYSYMVYVKEEVLDEGFLDSFPDLSYEGRKPYINPDQIGLVLDEVKRLRFTDEQIYLRSASVNRLNGMNFSCDGSHYIEHDEFFRLLLEFGVITQEADEIYALSDN